MNLGTVLLCKRSVWWNKSLRSLWWISVHTVLCNLTRQGSELDHQNKGPHSCVGTASITCTCHSSFWWCLLGCSTTDGAVGKMRGEKLSFQHVNSLANLHVTEKNKGKKKLL